MEQESISSAKMVANRNNASKSTGPKDTSRTRYNAVRLGLWVQDVITEREDKEEFVRFTVALLADLEPEGELEIILAERIAALAWRLKRALRIEASYIGGTYKRSQSLRRFAQSSDPDEQAFLDTILECLQSHSTLLNIVTYEGLIEKRFYKTIGELKNLQSDRIKKDVAGA